MYIASYEEMDVIEDIGAKANSTSEKIKEAIIEMNIMREKRISRDGLIRIIEEYN